MRKNIKKNLTDLLLIRFILTILFFVSASQTDLALAQTLRDEAHTRQVLDKFFKQIMQFEVAPTYGKVEFLEQGKKIVVSDVVMKIQSAHLKSRSLTLSNYSEDANGENFSIAQFLMSDITLEPHSALENQKAEFKFTGFNARDLKGSYKDRSIHLSHANFSFLIKNTTKDKILNEEIPLSIDLQNLKLAKLEKWPAVVDEMVAFGKFINTDQKIEEIRAFQVLSEDLAQVFENISFDHMIVSGPANVNIQGDMLKPGQFSIRNWQNGIIGEISYGGLQYEGINQKEIKFLKLDKYALRKVKIAEAFRLIPKLILLLENQKSVTDPIQMFSAAKEFAKVLQLLESISTQGFEMRAADFTMIQEAESSWGRYVDVFPTQINSKGSLLFKLPQRLNEQNLENANPKHKELYELFKLLGSNTLDVKYEMNLEWDEKRQSFIIAPLLYDINHFLAVRFELAIGNLPKQLFFETDPKRLAVLASGATMGPISIEVTDRGVQKIYEAKAKGSWEKLMTEEIPDPKTQEIIKKAKQNPVLGQIIDNIGKMVNAPNGRMKVTFKPKTSVNFAQLGAAMALDPSTLISLFDVETSYSQ